MLKLSLFDHFKAHFPNVTLDHALTTAVATKNPNIGSTNITTSGQCHLELHYTRKNAGLLSMQCQVKRDEPIQLGFNSSAVTALFKQLK